MSGGFWGATYCDYYVLLCIIMHYYVLVRVITYYYVLSRSITYYCVLLRIITNYHVLARIIMYSVWEASPGGREVTFGALQNTQNNSFALRRAWRAPVGEK